jgi:recombining binding protein (suppressor of hairless)
VSNFFYEDPKTGFTSPLDVYLGNLGPLTSRIFHTAPQGVLTAASQYAPASLPFSPGNVPFAEFIGRINASGVHTIVSVSIPPMADILKAMEEDALPPDGDESGSRIAENGQARVGQNGSQVPPSSIAGRTLPLLFIRAHDGVGYHSGRTVACENMYQTVDLGSLGGNPSNPAGASIDSGWLAAAQAAAAAERGLHGWTLKIM